ncbi:MAG: hypothetical protein HRT45_08315 [Bdellovibrionales bacterium]|nr:hypothetical protein [Bdellovibrionales bacterium]
MPVKNLSMYWGFFTFILCLSLYAGSSFAETFSGLIKRTQYRVELLTPNKRFLLFAANSLVANDLDKLQTGDYLQGFGSVGVNHISVKSVDLVGLRSLIGSWQAKDQTRIRITNFRQMQVFLPSRTLPASYDPPVEIEYAITPQDGSLWSILMNTSTDVQTGAMQIDEDEFSLFVHSRGQEPEVQTFRRINDE